MFTHWPGIWISIKCSPTDQKETQDMTTRRTQGPYTCTSIDDDDDDGDHDGVRKKSQETKSQKKKSQKTFCYFVWLLIIIVIYDDKVNK